MEKYFNTISLVLVSRDMKAAWENKRVKFLQDQGKVDRVHGDGKERTVCGRKLRIQKKLHFVNINTHTDE